MINEEDVKIGLLVSSIEAFNKSKRTGSNDKFHLTKEEFELLFHSMSNQTLAKLLGVSYATVPRMAKRLGIAPKKAGKPKGSGCSINVE